ncbi:MAG: energy transducer TonB [Gammaproteobacteria bacterium]|nr:energy transducer TonB [Gammaproteobacteria bacterium]
MTNKLITKTKVCVGWGLRAAVIILVGNLALAGCSASANRPLQLLSGQGPIYPAAARDKGVEGVVTVRYDVTVDGHVINARTVSARSIFDEAALVAVRSWRFNAPRVNGEVQATTNRESTVTFKLEGADRYDQY